MQLSEALTSLGVTDQTLTQAEKDQLDRDGFLPLANILSAQQIAQFIKRTDEMIAEEGQDAGKEVHQEAGATRLSDLVNKDPIFEICFTHPRVLAAISHVLNGSLKLSSLNYRAALPGSGLQGLHADWGGAVAPNDYFVCNSIWLLDDFTESNGATRIIPGSQRSGKVPRDVMPDPSQPHPDEILLTAPAGTVVIFNSHTWHGGTLNTTDHPRRAMHSYFTRRDQQQQLDQKAYIQPDTYQRLSPAARFILDV
jgi:ectoine hydroxylase-related dioxygenase (phytanoyl-CoA dioxygenase family)